MNIEDKINGLRAEIHRHNFNYHTLGKATISDAEYDLLYRGLVELEKEYPRYVDPNSPTVRVGSPVQGDFVKVKHPIRMLSLENSYTPEEVSKFFPKETKLISEFKFDGASLRVRYNSGQLVQAVTRGDGSTGDDVTANARTIKSIPLVLPEPLTIEVRGEVLMRISQFNALNEELAKAGEEQFANPRNAAAGAMKLKDSREVAARQLYFMAYAISEGGTATNQLSALSGLGKLGFSTPLEVPAIWPNTDHQEKGTPISSIHVADSDRVDDIYSIIEGLEKLRDKVDVETDGLVFKTLEFKVRDELGEGTKAPKWATAYKFPPERKSTKLLDIQVSIGRLGTLTPIAILEPVALSGTTVSRASLCNQDEIMRLLVDIGDTVLVEKSAEIIPKVVGVEKEEGNNRFWQMPTKCPSCGRVVSRASGKVAWRCTNKLFCKAQVRERLKHAVGKNALDWDGMGEAQVEFFVDKAAATNLSDLFEYTPSWVDTHMKPAAGKKFLAERERIKGAPLWRKLHALGIEGVGRSLCHDLCAKFHTLPEMLAKENWGQVKSILGEVFSANFRQHVLDNEEEIIRLSEFGYAFVDDEKAVGPLSGLSFVITGTMSKGREEVMKDIEAAGGVVKSSVTKNTTYLVQAEGGGANKAADAARHGTKIIDEEGLYKMMSDSKA